LTVTECDREPLAAVTVTVYVPAEPEHERVEVPELPRETLGGERLQVSPVVAETVADRLTVPVNPFTGVTVIVEVPLEPATKFTSVGLAATVKSLTE
jgi:hypothetical protein